jgi:hypothetical protein
VKRYKLKLQEQLAIQKSREDTYDLLVKRSTEHKKTQQEQLRYMMSDLDYYRNPRVLDQRYRNIFRPPASMKYISTKLDDDPYAETSKDRLTKIREMQSESNEVGDKIMYIKSKLVEVYKHLLWDHRSWM